MSAPLLVAQNRAVRYRRGTLASLTGRGAPESVQAVADVSLSVGRGDAVGLVGECGCGKTTLGRALLRLIEPSAGRLSFDGKDLLHLSAAELFQIRRRAQMVFQDPYGSLNPRLTVEETLSEVLRVHRLCPPVETGDRVRALMRRVGLSPDLASRRPHSLSGGQCQRVGIARALAVEPELIIADEPVSALDVSIQAQILNLLESLQREMNLSLLFISHDLGVVRHLCRRVAVMYLGRIVEFGPTEAVFTAPRHPYTQALLAAMPRLDAEERLPQRGLPGEPPSPARIPVGCPFHPRCAQAMVICRSDPAPEERLIDAVRVRCHLYPSPRDLETGGAKKSE